ncbi:hypothetical protein POM88_003505 [Heracleum sosnowskyi]|uniref:C3H1-type domain-containing protein n=1 Tax=Heracleum sosnowskyi TaxID=360622 RepID=A0AAD8JKY9_9APIA|nr:hypothetical protein POM88_003505 [Heracleum sosnowskyi]
MPLFHSHCTDGRENLAISMQANKRKKKSYHNFSWMDIPSFSGYGMSRTARRCITNYGTSKYDLEEVSRHFCREPIGLWRREHINTKSHSRWHSSEGNYEESRDSSDATMVWEGESTYEKSQKKSYRSRSRSPAYRFDRASVNDRRGRITTYDFINDKPRSTCTIPCKFFATGNCRNGSFCRFSHTEKTLDSFSNYKPDDHMQGIDSRVYMASPRDLNINASPCFRDESEGLCEQRAMRSYADDNAATENSFITHRMDSDEPTKDNGRSHLTLTAHSSSGMVVSESKGTSIRSADIEGSITYTENHLPTLNGTSGKPDVMDTVKSEVASSNQCQMGNEQISSLTNTLARLLEDGKLLPEMYAALSALNALGLIQYFVSGSAGPGVPASSSDQYDPVTDSLELVNSIIREQQDGILLTSQLLLTGSLGGDGLHGIDCKKAELNVNSLQSSEKALLADCKNEEQSILMAVEMKEGEGGGKLANNEGVGKAAEIKKNNDGKNLQTSEKAPFSDCKNQEHIIVKVEKTKKGQDRGKLVNNEGGDKADEIKKNNDGKSFRAFKFALAELVKELLCPTWKEGHINKEAYKTIVKNVVDKVIASVQNSHILQTKEKIDNYLSTSKPKILKLLQAYVEKFFLYFFFSTPIRNEFYGYHYISWMDIPASSGDGTGGSSSRPTTRYGTIKYDSKEVSNRLCGDDPGHDTYRNRSRSTSPRHYFHRAGSNDRDDLIASSDQNMSPRTRNFTSKFFASENCCCGNICLNSHADQTHNSSNYYRPDDCPQGIYSRVCISPAREGLEGSGAAVDFDKVPNWDKSKGIGEQMGLRSSADDYAVNSNRYMAHSSSGMSVSELRGTTDLGANIEGSMTFTGSQLLMLDADDYAVNNRYMAHSSSGMSVSEPRGTTVLGANIEGSMTFMGSQLLILDGTSREPGVLNTVRSEASSSAQCPRSSEQSLSLTDILTRLVEEIKLLPKLFAALSATNALVILQSFVAGSVGPDAPTVSSRQLDLVTDSLKLIRDKHAEVASSSKLPHGADPGSVGLNRTDCRNVELNVDSLPSGEKDQFAVCYNKEPNLSLAGEIIEKNDERKLVKNEVDGKDGQRMETTGGDSVCAFKLALIDFVKELLNPTYVRDQIDRDAYKNIVKRVVKKVTSRVQSIPQTQENIKKYLSTFRPNISKLVKEYVEIFKKEKASLA